MKTRLLILLLAEFSLAFGQQAPKAKDLRGVLLEQLRTTHNQKDWFVPVNIAVQGISAEQASWKDKSGNHSIGQLTYHLLFWNEQAMRKLSGDKTASFNGSNEETFDRFDSKTWSTTVQKLDRVLTSLEKMVTDAEEAKLQSWASEIAHIGTHNAYHTGQIVYIRRLQGSWNPEQGVK